MEALNTYPTTETTIKGELIPFKGTSLIELLRFRATVQAHEIAYTHLKDKNDDIENIAYGELYDRVRQLASYFQGREIQGERVILAYPSGIDYIVAYFAVIFAGGIAVPVFEPRQSTHFSRLESIIEDCKPSLLISTENTRRVTSEDSIQCIQECGIEWLTTDDLAELTSLNANNWRAIQLAKDDVVFLQYTSGSTGSPKGVMVTNGNLIHNSHVIAEATQPHENFVCVSWLPPYHDMGLIGGLLQPLFSGYLCVIMSPVAVIQRPYKLLKAISDYRGTIAGGPNFIFETCVQRVRDSQIEGIDLSSWQIAFNGAEPIHAATLELFNERFADYGFDTSAHFPCYGLAENTLFVSGAQAYQGAVVKRFDKEALKQGRAKHNENNGHTLVSSGKVASDIDVVIVNPESCQPVVDCEIGEVWIKGDSLPLGYWQRESITGEDFAGRLSEGDNQQNTRYFRTGDLAFLDNSQLYITGRIKDLIIIRGKNHYPQDIELTVENSHAAIKAHTCAAFSYFEDNTEKVAALIELKNNIDTASREIIASTITAQVSLKHDLKLSDIHFIKPGTLPKTTSGKIQRRLAKKQYQESCPATSPEVLTD